MGGWGSGGVSRRYTETNMKAMGKEVEEPQHPHIAAITDRVLLYE